jgi:hypothetical protein
LIGCASAQAAEGFNVRLLGGTVGRELFAPSVPGHYGTLNLIYYNTTKIKGDDGKALTTSVAAGPNVIPVAVDLEQTQMTALLRYVWVSEAEWLGAKFGGTVALPLVSKTRSLVLTPSFPPALPAQARNQIGAQLRAQEALNNGSATGQGDLELAPTLSWEGESSKWVFAPTVILPTGRYDSAQALNAGQGNHYTFRPALSWGYVASDRLQFGVRALWGINSTNKDTDVQTGQFVSLEAVAYTAITDAVSAGLNAFAIRQIEDDEGPGVAAHGNRMSLSGLGAALAWRAGSLNYEIKFNKEFSGRNTREGASAIFRVAMPF